MKILFHTALIASGLLLAGGAMAAPRTVTLEVENVSCVTCVPTVKKALSRIPGVSQVAVIDHGGMATATVTFDDEKVTPEALTQATTNAGYPSTVKGAKGSS
ncbi:mercury resistance system periplasmic binding protein MerP [Microvirga sp. VF16]|uniref:mercury resistance system periplasmic binding protein MerP n=1 Tax=Microvirga sp. VF16 TaxID=2807101 RepID=UPI00193C9D7A|nr:mercury resistance system periplasmic binding protein MerP [Microvirga sp. VF16]QRM34715.1 mercury resistance system periplasmic binding protein MerP [Microvirga sp. VF16]